MRGRKEILTVLCAPTISQQLKPGDSTSFSAPGILKSVSYRRTLLHSVGPRTTGFTFKRNRFPLDESSEWDLKVPLKLSLSSPLCITLDCP